MSSLFSPGQICRDISHLRQTPDVVPELAPKSAPDPTEAHVDSLVGLTRAPIRGTILGMRRALDRAKDAARDGGIGDEWFTLRPDVVDGIDRFADQMRGRRVHCNCDGPESRFVDVLIERYDDLGLAGLVATGLWDGKGWRYDHGSGWREIDADLATYQATLDEPADLVVTNPPFSLLTDYFPTMLDAGKDLLVIAPSTSVSTLTVLPYLLDGRLAATPWKVNPFERPNGSLESAGGDPGWVTTLDFERQSMPLDVDYDPRYNPTFEGSQVVEAATRRDIPQDYAGPIAIPVTAVRTIDPAQFEILGTLQSLRIGGRIWGESKEKFGRLVVRRVNPDPAWRTDPVHPLDTDAGQLDLPVRSGLESRLVVPDSDVRTWGDGVDQAMERAGYVQLPHVGETGPGWVQIGIVPSLRRSRAKVKPKSTSPRKPSAAAAARRLGEKVYAEYIEKLEERGEQG